MFEFFQIIRQFIVDLEISVDPVQKSCVSKSYDLCGCVAVAFE